MNDKILNDIKNKEEIEYQNKMITKLIKEDPSILKEYPILEIEYNVDGTKKSLYSLASEKDIKSTQIKSDENELDFKYSQNKITKEEYDKENKLLEIKLENQNLVYDDLIFDIINNEDIEVIKEEIKNSNLNSIDLKRLASSLTSIAENKISDFQKNNKDFNEENISYWNYKYDIIAKGYSKARELESYILSLIN